MKSEESLQSLKIDCSCNFQEPSRIWDHLTFALYSTTFRLCLPLHRVWSWQCHRSATLLPRTLDTRPQTTGKGHCSLLEDTQFEHMILLGNIPLIWTQLHIKYHFLKQSSMKSILATEPKSHGRSTTKIGGKILRKYLYYWWNYNEDDKLFFLWHFSLPLHNVPIPLFLNLRISAANSKEMDNILHHLSNIFYQSLWHKIFHEKKSFLTKTNRTATLVQATVLIGKLLSTKKTLITMENQHALSLLFNLRVLPFCSVD